jgi:hypothetical protein
MGIVRLETHGVNANEEMPALIDGLSAARNHGVNVRATLRIEPRTSKKDGETRNFVVPVLDVQMSLDQLESGEVPQSAQIEPPSASKQIESQTSPAVEPDEPPVVVHDEAVAPAENTDVISEAQARRMFAIARQNIGEKSNDVVKRVVKWMARVESSKAVPREAYESIITVLETWPESESMLESWEETNK